MRQTIVWQTISCSVPSTTVPTCLLSTFRSPAALLSNPGFGADVGLFACAYRCRAMMPCSTERPPTPPLSSTPACEWHEWLHRSVTRDAQHHERARLMWHARLVITEALATGLYETCGRRMDALLGLEDPHLHAFEEAFPASGCACFLHVNTNFSMN